MASFSFEPKLFFSLPPYLLTLHRSPLISFIGLCDTDQQRKQFMM